MIPFMGTFMKHIDIKTCLPVIAGLSLLWFSFHASPYYPFSLSAAFSATGAEGLSAKHSAYTFAFLIVLTTAFVLPKYFARTYEHSSTIYCVVAISGSAGCALQIVGTTQAAAQQFIAGASLSLVALYAGTSFVMWLTQTARLKANQAAFSIAVSYFLFGLVWSILLVAGNTAFKAFAALCPLLSIPCFVISLKRTQRPAEMASLRLASLPWNIIALCLVFIYFGIISVRAFTTMEMGGFFAGSLGAAPQIVTALAGSAACCCLAWLFAKKGTSPSTFVTAFALLALAYMAALLVVVLGDQSQTVTLVGKRILVAAEHSVEILLAIVLACEASRRNSCASSIFALYGAAVLAVPQFITLDLMYQSGVLESLASISLVTPLAAIGAFAVAAACIVMLMRFSTRTAAEATEQSSDWQQDLCRKALAGHDVTPREFDVVLFTYRGYSAKRIAEELLVSESTVKAHLSHAYRKLGVHTKQELISIVDQYRAK